MLTAVCIFCKLSHGAGPLLPGKRQGITGRYKAPMQSASVQAQHTTIGTATDTEGNFTIYLPEGGYELAFSFTGYQRRVAASVHPTVTSKH